MLILRRMMSQALGRSAHFVQHTCTGQRHSIELPAPLLTRQLHPVSANIGLQGPYYIVQERERERHFTSVFQAYDRPIGFTILKL